MIEPLEVALYKEFRKELDSMWVPGFIKNHIEDISLINDESGIAVGFMHVMDEEYIDALYILPNHRKKGYGSKAVREWIEDHGVVPEELIILKNNPNALDFWRKLFQLRAIGEDETDIRYRIIRYKKGGES